MHRLKSMVHKLSKYYWSPLPPERYVLSGGECEPRGIGTVASRSYGCFNLAWRYCNGDFSTTEQHTKGIKCCMAAYPLMYRSIDGANMDTWLTLLSEEEFIQWWKSNGKRAPLQVRILVDTVLAEAEYE